ncbi:MOSC domain-containing protein [Nocardioides seonyuensis]|uniref:MOSC domain-containing protein n=1 Tax=Nocardioides seonyuensis TaxID=2518371 RepID=A0A4P7IKK7_9ACTN|nr:MOSC N-terminal beta barrel domain-containing protein [Nocardioides seonyuensis]QBX56907.1 MOSC domain-containing protein [Nocardioides seonyuensis]
MRLTGLNVHPVKSTAIRPLGEAVVLRSGLADDRSWVVVDADGVLVCARKEHSLFTITADTPATDRSVTQGLRLRAAGLDDLTVQEPTGPLVRARVHKHELQGVPAGPEADAWVSKALGRDGLRLVWCDDPSRRGLNPEFSSPGDHTAFADGYPVTIASEASLLQLNRWIDERRIEEGEAPQDPLPMLRFRPNLVVDGDEPFAEDRWSRVRVGGVGFRVAKKVDRCVMTTLDPETLRTAREPVRTLARHRLFDGLPMFAMFLIPETTGLIRTGDPVEVTG